MTEATEHGTNAATTAARGGPATTLATPPSPLERARLRTAELRANGIPVLRLDPIEKAAANPRSLRLAITGKCWDCCGAGQDPNTRATIAACRVTRCSLHPVRPYQRADDE